MTLHCPHCAGPSTVVLTRHASGVQLLSARGKRPRQVCAVRTRQCRQCSYKWKTIEVPLHRLQRTARMR